MSTLSPASILRFPYTPDLTHAGIAYAMRSLAYTYDRMGGSPFLRLRRIVAGKAVELAFRRYLDAQQVPYDNLGSTPFTDPDRYDIALGGHRCDLKSFLVSRRDAIRQVRRQPDVLRRAAALVPVDQLVSEHLRAEDLYIFAFASALVAAHSKDTQQAQAKGSPVYLMHPFPARWARPLHWKSLGRLTLKLESAPSLAIEIGGQTALRDFHIESLHLEPGQCTSLKADFFSISYLHVEMLPTNRIGIHSTRLDETYLVEPSGWGNIWVYGMDIFLGGYMPRHEFRQRAAVLPAGSRVWQYARTRTANYALPVDSLHPLGELLDRVKAWESKKSIKNE
ncbi:MAG: hypothetical protein ACOYYS_28005 [Chloroflexota bacterium]